MGVDLTAGGLAQIAAAGKPSAKPPAPPTDKERVLSVQWVDRAGVRQHREVTSRVLTPSERLQVARAMASLTGGILWESFPPGARLRIEALATVAVQLREIPPDFDEALQVDDELLIATFHACQAHDSEFFRGSPEQSQGDEERPRVVVEVKNAPSAF